MTRKPVSSVPKPASLPQPGATPSGIRIRMYRLGVGDCFLLTLPGRGGAAFHMLIDCGIHAAETDGRNRIRRAVEDISRETGGRIDVVIGTHEHWDHLSGFLHAQDIFAGCKAGAIWCAWTEDLRDPVARGLLGSRDQGVTALWGAVGRLRLADSYGAAAQRNWDGVLGFFGDSPGIGPKAKAAAEAMRSLAASEADIVYRNPGEPPFDSASDDWRIFVLGPPRDRGQLEHIDPRKGSGEAYPLAAVALADIAMAAGSLASAVSVEDDPPFEERFQIPLEATRAIPFFQDHYWSDHTQGDAPEEREQAWRRLGEAWLDGAEPLALKLDAITNNTSLVLAVELGPKTASDNPVLLFAADAQIGNWQSWPAVEWPDYGGRRVTGADLLRRTVLYKVGHHASHNATLMDGGLETMDRLRLALVPTSAEMAGKVGWGTLPWPALLERLGQKTAGHVLRSDQEATADALTVPGFPVTASDLCFDVVIPIDTKGA